MVNAKFRTVVFSFLCAVSAAFADETAVPSLDLSGRWKDVETGDRYDIVHHDNTVTARLVDSDNRCRINDSDEKRDPLFMANVKGTSLAGKLSVCVPQSCAGKVSPHRWTEFVAEVTELDDPPGSEPVSTHKFIGTWLDEELDEETCTLTGKQSAQTGFDAERLPCDEIQVVSKAYKRAQDLFKAYSEAADNYDGRSFNAIKRDIESRFTPLPAGSDPRGEMDRGIKEYRNSFRLPSGGTCVRDRARMGSYCCANPQISECGGAGAEFLNGLCLSHEEVHVKNTGVLLQYVASGFWTCDQLQSVETLTGEGFALPLLRSEIEAYEADLASYRVWLDGYQAKFEVDCKGAEGW